MTTETIHGSWWNAETPDQKYGGVLTVESGKQPVLELRGHTLILQGATGPGVQFPGSTLVAAVHGDTSSGHFVLLDCQWGGMSMGLSQTTKLLARYAVSGIGIDGLDEEFVKRVDLRVPALSAMLGRYPVRPMGKGLRNKAKTARFAVHRAQHDWENGTTRVRWWFNPRTHLAPTSAKIEMHPEIVFRDSEKRSLRYCIEHWIRPSLGLIEVATGIEVTAAEIRLWQVQRPDKRHRFEYEPVRLYAPWVDEAKTELTDADLVANVVDVNMNPDGVMDLLEKFTHLQSTHIAFVDRLSVVMENHRQKRDAHSRFLDLSAGLEAYHSKTFGRGEMAQDDFVTRRDEVVQALKSSGLNPDELKFATKYLKKSSADHGLSKRLSDLGAKAGLKSKWKKSKVTHIEMAEYRNVLAHGGEPPSTDFRIAYEQLYELARKIVLIELGMINS